MTPGPALFCASAPPAARSVHEREKRIFTQQNLQNPTMKRILLLAVMAAFVSACKKESKPVGELSKAQWFLGNWENQTPQGDLYENWKQENDSLYLGESFFVKGKDTLFSEQVQLAQKGKDVFYTVSVKGQNDEKPVPFKLTKASADTLVFENPAHDFPNKILYRKVNKDSIVAAISGTQEGKPAGETYPMGRRK